MAPKKKPRAALGKSAKWYRDNPEGVKKKDKKSKEVNSREGQKAKRRELIKSNRKKDKADGKNSRKGLDASHQKDGSIKYESSKKNRGGKTTSGDKNARGKKK